MTSPLIYVSFPGTAREALGFYASVFGGELSLHTYAEFGRNDGPRMPSPTECSTASSRSRGRMSRRARRASTSKACGSHFQEPPHPTCSMSGSTSWRPAAAWSTLLLRSRGELRTARSSIGMDCAGSSATSRSRLHGGPHRVRSRESAAGGSYGHRKVSGSVRDCTRAGRRVWRPACGEAFLATEPASELGAGTVPRESCIAGTSAEPPIALLAESNADAHRGSSKRAKRSR